MREAELQAAREGRSVDNVEVDEEKAREDFLVFFEYVLLYHSYSVLVVDIELSYVSNAGFSFRYTFILYQLIIYTP